MRIISEFKDYYDHASGFGQDLSLVYVRKQSERQFSRTNSIQPIADWHGDRFKINALCNYLWALSVQGVKNNYKTNVLVKNHFLVVAGKLYYAVSVEGAMCYTFEQMEQALKQYAASFPSYRARNTKAEFNLEFYNYARKQGTTIPVDHLLQDCIASQVPVVMLSLANGYSDTHVLFEFNPNLKAINFQEKLDSLQCYQEIEMLISAMTQVKLDKMPDFDDNYKLLAHGFDKQVSFRPKSR